MTLIVETPNTRVSERDYIIGVLLGEFLGLNWMRRSAQRTNVRITVAEHRKEALILPDELLQVSDERWLTSGTLPTRGLPVWDASELKEDISLINNRVPVLYGDRDPVVCRGRAELRLPIDIFGSAFFMLSRYEEIVKRDRDEHDRFPATASLAYQEGFLARPIIDEYVELLWAGLSVIAPELQRKARSFEIKVSHDVDEPSNYQFSNAKQFLRRVGGDVLKRRDLPAAIDGFRIRASGKRQLHSADPANTFDWIMDVSERRDLSSAFYFICGRTDPVRDAAYDSEFPAIRSLMRRIHERGHEIGLHPSYKTYRDPEAIVAEAARLKKVCVEEKVDQAEWGGRMHFLRWSTPVTLRGWESAGMTYDSTLGFADHAGFRCGTCHEYPAFDALRRSVLRLRLRPLVAMECTVMASRYMGHGSGEAAYEAFSNLKSACRTVSGTFTLLWHNTQLATSHEKRLYKNILAA